MNALKSFFHTLRMNPLRGTLVLVTVTVGVATTITTTSLGLSLGGVIGVGRERPVVIANGVIDASGALQPNLANPQFDASAIAILRAEYQGLTDVAVVHRAFIAGIQANGRAYAVRSALQVGEAYADTMGLEMAAGRFFDASDTESGRRVAVLSALASTLLFGSAEAGLGRQIGLLARDGLEPYEIVGVHADVPDVERVRYGIGDLLLPIGAGLPGGLDVNLTTLVMQRGGVIVARTRDGVEQTRSMIRSILEPTVGDDLQVAVWEGAPDSPMPGAGRISDGVRSFALAATVLGFIILAVGSVGIFSVMLVEVLGRTRDIGLRRAFGMTKAGVRRFFVGQALLYSLTGSLAGSLLALLLYRPSASFLTPLLASAGVQAEQVVLAIPGPLPFLIAVGVSLVFGALFGFFPAISAANLPITECLREDAG